MGTRACMTFQEQGVGSYAPGPMAGPLAEAASRGFRAGWVCGCVGLTDRADLRAPWLHYTPRPKAS